ncbi:MFS transporter [Enteractinococcus coprophilus]|uniref:MFS transporter n=1 Tax=Enteractinococcus coprophilus TaxID=1027633 RepID=UPI001B86922A|nr:MFS transporter [Enteractinococcus coprophilus]
MAFVWQALGALCVGLFITLMDQSLIAIALPQMTEELDASVNQAVWVSAIYLLTFAVPLLVTGRLGDRFEQRNVYLVGMAIFVLAATACAFAPTIELLIFARAVQGFGAALLNPQPLSVIHRIFPYHQRGAAMGIWSAVASSSGLFGPVVGGFLAGGLGWRWVFFYISPLASSRSSW